MLCLRRCRHFAFPRRPMHTAASVPVRKTPIKAKAGITCCRCRQGAHLSHAWLSLHMDSSSVTGSCAPWRTQEGFKPASDIFLFKANARNDAHTHRRLLPARILRPPQTRAALQRPADVVPCSVAWEAGGRRLSGVRHGRAQHRVKK